MLISPGVCSWPLTTLPGIDATTPFPPEVPWAAATSVKASRAAAVNAKETISDFMSLPSQNRIV
jgi:hypothetical protein